MAGQTGEDGCGGDEGPWVIQAQTVAQGKDKQILCILRKIWILEGKRTGKKMTREKPDELRDRKDNGQGGGGKNDRTGEGAPIRSKRPKLYMIKLIKDRRGSQLVQQQRREAGDWRRIN